ncbi:hypothetical protein C0989_002090 [Termitomyces sp. Mn162]|nr:hypothetical protein C0989_002090 [Termitomyces sp. Mn162]
MTNPATSSGASSEDAPSEESMKLDYVNNSLLTTSVQPVMTPLVILSPMDAVVATNVATPSVSEAGFSGPSNMANAVLECWADIMSNEEAVAS